MSFEVASVRQAGPKAPYSGNVDLDTSNSFTRYNGGLVTMEGSLVNYILFAYKVDDASQYPQIYAQLPKWAQAEQFIVEAQPAGNPTKDQIRLMMQSLLAERFKFAIHTETKQLPAYALVLDKSGKPGPQLHPHLHDGLCTKAPDPAIPVHKGTAYPPYCGLLFWRPANGQTHMRMMDFSMDAIAGQLAVTGYSMGGLDHLPVLNQTGLDGRFDIDLEFLRSSAGAQPPAADSETSVPAPSFADALQRQAGLKLVKETGPVNISVIDHIEQPSEN